MEKIHSEIKNLKAIEHFINVELNIIDEHYNEVPIEMQQAYNGMKAAYNCILNIISE